MAEQLKPDICIIGAGAAGLSLAAAAGAFGVPAVLIEKGRMGGESLNTGCVPSKAMLASARYAEFHRNSGQFGVQKALPGIEFDKVNDRIHRVISAVAPNDSKERFTGLGVRVIEGAARFRDSRTVVVGLEHGVSYEITARRFVIATGSLPAVPPIPGIEQIPYFTNENIFETRERPQHLIIIGAGSNGLELAQAFRRLGSEVTVVERDQPLRHEDQECTAIVLDTLAREGVTVRRGAKVQRLRRLRQRIEVVLDNGEAIQGSDLLLAAGRRPNVEGLNLEAAKVQHQPDGILIDKHFRTSNRSIYAIGDVTGLPQYTHAASHEASLLIRRLLFRRSTTMNLNEIPRVTFTEPELAHVGLTADEAGQRRHAIRVLRWSFRENDRAQAEGTARGHIKVVTNRKGAILGVTIVGAAASEQITTWTLAIANKLNIRAFAEIVMPYPTYSEVGRRAAISFFAPQLTTSWARRLFKFMRRFG